MIFVQQLKALHERDPNRVAVTMQFSNADDLSISIDQLLRGSQAFAHAYRAAGIKPGGIVVLILQHGENLLYAYWGAILLGAIPSIMPFLTEKLSPERYRAELAALVTVTKPSAIVTYPEFEEEIQSANLESDCSLLVFAHVEPVKVLDLNSLPGFRRKAKDIVLLQHSSGTTGLQKGVALSHKAVFNQLDAYSRALELNIEDVIVSWLPLYHDMGLIAGFIMPILSGVRLVLMSPFDWVRAPFKLMHSISKYGGTLVWMPNFAYNFCVQKMRNRHLEGINLSSLRAIINCSEPIRWESHDLFYKRFQEYGLSAKCLQTSYAMAENVFCVTQSDFGDGPIVDELDRESYVNDRLAIKAKAGEVSMKLISSGRPLENTEIRILDESGCVAPDRTVGEIAIRSNCMLTEYYNRRDLTEKALVDGWYLTGDYGYLADGELFVTGRKKDLIIVGGRNVYPQDLETLTHDIDGVHRGRCVAFGIFDEKQGTEDVVIVAEVDTDNDMERKKIADEIRLYVTKNSAIALRYVKIVGPKWIIKTSSGKISRSANKDKYLMLTAGK